MTIVAADLLDVVDPRSRGDCAVSGLTDDAVATALALVRGWCRWHVTPARSDLQVIDHFGGRVLKTRSLHVLDVLSVRATGSTTDVAHEWSAAGMIRRRDRCEWASGYRAWEVRLIHGYDLAECLPVARVLLSIARRVDAEAAGDRSADIVQESIGDYSYQMASTSAASQVSHPGLAASRITISERLALAPFRIALEA